VQRYLKQEQSTAKNIKNKQVRAGVVKALSDIIQNMPVGNSGSNGMVILAGRIKSYI
jgi:peptide subunit release factor 1 (eRF1)